MVVVKKMNGVSKIFVMNKLIIVEDESMINIKVIYFLCFSVSDYEIDN